MSTKNVRFLVAGILDKDNPDCVSFEKIKYWESLGIIDFCGYIKNMKDLISQSNIVVLPSYYGEGLPKILIEAAACGKPVITTCFNPVSTVTIGSKSLMGSLSTSKT